MMEKNARLESILAERNQLQNRVKTLEDRGFDGNNKSLETISKLTGKIEHLETELKIAEERQVTFAAQMETQVILCKDREKQIHQLQEEMEAKDERLSTFTHELESSKQHILQREKQIADLQDKFMQSSTHVMEETIM